MGNGTGSTTEISVMVMVLVDCPSKGTDWDIWFTADLLLDFEAFGAIGGSDSGTSESPSDTGGEVVGRAWLVF